jgi:hypothetical protein
VVETRGLETLNRVGRGDGLDRVKTRLDLADSSGVRKELGESL